MQTLTQAIIDAGLKAKVLHDSQLAFLLDGTAQRRYNLVTRALASGGDGRALISHRGECAFAVVGVLCRAS